MNPTQIFTTNDEAAIRTQIKTCQGNLEMLMDFAPNHPLVLKNINQMHTLVEVLESIQAAK